CPPPQDAEGRATLRRRAPLGPFQRRIVCVSERSSSAYGVGHRHRTLAPETMLMFRPEITCPFTSPGERAMFRSGANKVPSTIALQHPVPPPPPEKATCSPVPMMLYSTAPGCTPPATRI